jgi:hypothetical protein
MSQAASASRLLAACLVGTVSTMLAAKAAAGPDLPDRRNPSVAGTVAVPARPTAADQLAQHYAAMFGGERLTAALVADLTAGTRRDLLAWGDCTVGLRAAGGTDLDVATPNAQGCLYLLFGVPGSVVRDTYRKWVEYWLLDTPCAGRQRNGCYLGYTIDTRLNSESTPHRTASAVTATSTHEIFKAQPRVRGPDRRADGVRRGGLDTPRRSAGTRAADGKAARRAARTAAAPARSAAALGGTATASVGPALTLAGTLVIEVVQTFEHQQHETATTYYTPTGEPIGDTHYTFAIAQSEGGPTDDCATKGAAAGDKAGDVVGDVLYAAAVGGGAVTGVVTGAASGAVGGAAAGAALAATDGIPLDEIPSAVGGAAAGAAAGAVAGGAAGAAIGDTLGSFYDVAVGGATDALVEVVVTTGCEATSGEGESGTVEPPVAEGPGPTGGGGGVVVTGGGDEDEDENGRDDETDEEDDENADDGTEDFGAPRRVEAQR